MIEAVRGKGANRASVKCDSCDRMDTVPCGYQRTTASESEPITGQVVSKITAAGWSVVKGKHFCPSCEAKRKTQNHEAKMAAKEMQETEAPRAMTPKQKREIIGMLELAYDDDRKRYKDGESDKSVAAAIGDGCMWGWGAQVRDELFGPDTKNEEIEALRKDMSAIQADIEAAKADAKRTIESLESRLAGIRRQFEKVAA